MFIIMIELLVVLKQAFILANSIVIPFIIVKVSWLRKKSQTRTTFPRGMCSTFGEEEGQEVSKIASKGH